MTTMTAQGVKLSNTKQNNMDGMDKLINVVKKTLMDSFLNLLILMPHMVKEDHKKGYAQAIKDFDERPELIDSFTRR